MLEYVLSLYFVVLAYFILKHQPTTPSFALKTVELAMVIYITYRHPLLGLACTMILLRQTVEPMVSHTKKPTRLPVEEQMRSKSSNTIHVEKPHGLPSQESYTGQMARPYKNEPSKKYTPF
jgi:hypothetical protein